uniref:NADH-ubiquinone oxidoreductase chain 5 n=1 Tax=Melyridae sp. GENSP01 TaxID=1205563 RepID=A0A0S2MPI3_9CUCU|nr:NADH deshydrogenase subunit 5 [Melyridae sp. GENSP01]
MMSINVVYFIVLFVGSLTFFSLSLSFMYFDLVVLLEYYLINLNSSSVLMTILLDWMSLLFLSFVLFISSMVILYSKEYMLGDMNMNRFIILVVMFVVSMMLLIISPNLISILLGWDGLGLVSYCLVIYYQNVKSFSAGMLTALTNRIGDVALLMSIAWMMNYGSWNFVFYLDYYYKDGIMQFITWLIILAAMTKSAQIPFSSWLPAAMAAPTPVSSLVHSSTLVTAGVYLLIRFNYSFTEGMKMFLLFIASLTMFMSGVGANFEFDLKKIIALSTLSQLGLMMSILALGSYSLAFFHLLTHALFKALLFMCAGSIIHNYSNCQDIRFLGSMVYSMPLTCTFFNISNMSLCGLPFLSGFYSKDLVVEFMSMGYLNIYIYFIFYISIGLTVCYSFRLLFYLVGKSFSFFSLNSLSESWGPMIMGMSGLILFVVFSGSMLSWLMFSTPYFICLSLLMKLMTLMFVVLGVLVGLEASKMGFSFSESLVNNISLKSFLGSMWNMPLISTLGVNYWFLVAGKSYYKKIDQGWSEYLGAQNLYKSLTQLAKFNQIVFSNNFKVYLLLLVFWVFVLIVVV